MKFFYLRFATTIAFYSFFTASLFVQKLEASAMQGKIPVSVWGESTSAVWRVDDPDLQYLVLAERSLLEQDDDEEFESENLSMLPVIKLQEDGLFAGVNENGWWIEIWQIDTQNPIQRLFAHMRKILFFTQLEDGRIVSADDRIMRIWDVESGESVVLHQLAEEKNVAFFLKYSDERLGVVYQDGILEEVLVG